MSSTINTIAPYHEYFCGVVDFSVEGSAGQVGAGDPEAVAEDQCQCCDCSAVVE